MALDSSGRICLIFSQCAAGGLFERVFPRKNQAGAEKSPDGGTPATARDVFEYYRGFFEKGSSVCYGEGGETFLSFSDPLYKWGDTEWLVYSAECLEGGREDLCLTSFNGRQGGHQRLFRIGYEPSQEGGLLIFIGGYDGRDGMYHGNEKLYEISGRSLGQEVSALYKDLVETEGYWPFNTVLKRIASTKPPEALSGNGPDVLKL